MNQEKIPPTVRNVKLKDYFCPHCQKRLMKGDVKRLNMTCPFCQKMIDADEEQLLKREMEQ
jgi:uncharacterized protein YlaI